MARLARVAALTIAMATAATVPARAQDPLIRYTVRRGDTCASIARRFLGDPRRYDILHEHNPGLGAPPHRLVAGSVMLVPRRPDTLAPGPDARVTATRRRVEARAPDDSGWRAAAPGLPLARGWRVNTFEDAGADIAFRDTSAIHVREHTLVIIYGPSRELARRLPSRATLERGTLRSRLGELADGGRVDVETPAGQAVLRGGEAVVSVDAEGTSRIANHAGDAEITGPGGERVRLPAGTGASVARGGVPTRPRPLPDAPAWSSADAAGRSIGITGHGGTLRGEWQPVENAIRYRVEVARGADGSDVIAAAEVPADVTRFEIHRIPAGVYYVSVATIDRDYFEGRPSPRRAMRVLEARLIPPGGAPADPPPPYDPGDPSIAFRPPVVAPGTWIVAPMGFVCAPDGAEPTAMSTLERAGRLAVRCRDAAQRELPAFEVIVSPVRVSPEPASAAAVPRRGDSVVPLRISCDAEVPPRFLATAPATVDLARIERAPSGDWRLVVRPGERAPRAFEVILSVPAAQQTIPVANVRIEVVDPRAAVRPPAPPRPADPAPPADAPVAHALGALPLPSAIAARPADVHGIHARVAGGWIDDAGLVRAAASVTARAPGTPLRVAAAIPIDAAGDHARLARRGQGDPWVGLAAIVAAAPRFALTIEASSFVPTARDDAARLGFLRFAPSLELTAHPQPVLTLRVRQGAILDATGDGSRLWASAYAIDVRPLPVLALSLELDASVGREEERTRYGTALAAGAALRAGDFTTSAAFRLGLGADGRALLGDRVLGLSLTWSP